MSSSLIQYTIVRRDLVNVHGWTLGAVMAQACHAVTKMLVLHRDHPNVQAYIHPAHLDTMHKAILQVDSEEDLRVLAGELSDAQLEHILWIEQPENIPTAIAVIPYPKDQTAKILGRLRLYR